MNLSAFARSLSNSLRFGVGSKKHLEPSSPKREPPLTSLDSPESKSESDAKEELKQKRLNKAEDSIIQQRQPYKETVEQILQKVSELEHTLYEDQQLEFKLRMALERQTERMNELHFSLDTEKQRNGRLVQLLRGMDTNSSSESDPETQLLSGMRIHSNGDVYGSISPLLMQQRYDELCVSHRQTHRQLAKKEKAIKLLQCDFEELRSKYDSMHDSYRNEQRRLESLCTRYVRMQKKKKKEICVLKETLGYASECILHAQVAIESGERGAPIAEKHLTTFNINLELFMRALRNCCCQRKLQELQQQQSNQLLADGQLDTISAPSVGNSSNCISESPPRKRRLRSRTRF